MILVSGSPRHICSRSFKLTCALFPREQNFANPTPKVFACSRIAMPSAPLCVTKEIPPRSGGVGAKVASIRMSGWVLMTPMQFGPIIVRPCCRQISSRRASRSTPAPPTSRKPAVITERPSARVITHGNYALRLIYREEKRVRHPNAVRSLFGATHPHATPWSKPHPATPRNRTPRRFVAPGEPLGLSPRVGRGSVLHLGHNFREPCVDYRRHLGHVWQCHDLARSRPDDSAGRHCEGGSGRASLCAGSGDAQRGRGCGKPHHLRPEQDRGECRPVGWHSILQIAFWICVMDVFLSSCKGDSRYT